jgi:CheY-like chemotaxis protein
MRMVRLLLVDDSPDNLEVLAVLLAEKYRVWSYGSAAEALRALETVKPDVLVLDIGMVPVDGVECLAAIRAIPGYSGVPAIALTAFARDIEREAFLGAGFQAVVTKPILDDELIVAVDTLIESPAPAGSPAPRETPAATLQRQAGDGPMVSAAS